MRRQASYNNTFLKALQQELIPCAEVHDAQYACLKIAASLYLLPSFLHEIAYLHFILALTTDEIATTLNIAEALTRQRIAVSITLLRLLYASKPKNPV